MVAEWFSILRRWDTARATGEYPVVKPRHCFLSSIVPTIAVCTCFSSMCLTRDPVELSLDELLAKSDCVVLAKVEQTAKSGQYKDLDSLYFDEYVVTVEVCSVLKGTIDRGSKLAVVAYRSNGKGMPGNFGSTMRLLTRGFAACICCIFANAEKLGCLQVATGMEGILIFWSHQVDLCGEAVDARPSLARPWSTIKYLPRNRFIS